ncbi:MAG: M15 family metallopeptidase [Massilia sp.]
MLIFIALLYFCLACSVIWLLAFPAGREAALRQVQGWGRRMELRLARRRQYGGGRRTSWSAAIGNRAVRVGRFLRRHAMLAGVAAALVIIPSGLALWMSNPGMLPGFEAASAAPDAQIAALLKGEQLAPPVALPPLAFSTLEVTQVRPMLADASRNWTMLNADFSQRLLLVFKIMKEKHGYDMALLEGYRSPERQNLLASMGSQVSNARAFQSWHQYGLAADCAFLREGRIVISEKDPWAMRGYQLYGEVAESLGLTWGGRWTMMDFGHTELRVAGVMRK